MAPSSATSITTASPKTHSRAGSLSLRSPVQSPADFSTFQTEDLHAFRAPGPEDSRSPCPALNTLANHGYLSRNGRDISAEDLMTALEDERTYHVEHKLAELLTRGGKALMLTIHRISLHELAKHVVAHGWLGIEHNASLVHKNAPDGAEYAPIRCDTGLLNELLLVDDEFLTLEHIAKRRVEREMVSKLDPLHAEIARGEWALVLDIFGQAHGGEVRSDEMRVWLKENRFPAGWKPTHQQSLEKTREKATALREKMAEFRTHDELDGGDLSVWQLPEPAQVLQSTREGEDRGGESSRSITPQSPPRKRRKTVAEDSE